nr:integrase, catalytic region, zinc finger, CCHC-type, peptidase aspartic, catalytic [Tanacetum cinerariifolium]
MTTPTVTSSTDSQMHNNIMAASSRNHPPMLATERYPQWRSRFLRYIDTRPNGEALRKCILSGPYKPNTVLVQAVDATDDSPAIPEHTTVETPMNMTLENKAHFEGEKEAIHLILTRIGDEIYSTVDACQTAQEMLEAIERLQQGESLNIEDVKTNLFLEFGKFTLHDRETMETYYTRFYKLMNEMMRNNLTVAMMQVNVQFLQQLQPEWSRFVTIVKQQHKLDEVSYHKLFDILKQYKKKVNKLRAEKLAREANPLALVATAQANQDPYYQTSKSHKSHEPSSKPSILTRSHTTTRYKGKEIAKPITPSSETASEEDSDPEQAQRIRICKRIWLSLQSTSRRSTNLPTTTSEHPQTQGKRMNAENQKGLRTSRITRGKMLLCKQAEQGVPLQAEQYDWLEDMDEDVTIRQDSNPEQAQRDKDMQKNLALVAKYFKKIYKPTNNNLRTSSNSKNKNVDTTTWEKVGSRVVQKSGIQCFNCREYGHFAKECRKPKRVKDSAYHKEKMLLCKQVEQGVPQQAEQYDWLANTDEEVDEQELEAYYSYMAKIQEAPNADLGADSKPNDQNDVKSDDERVTLANLIANLKLDVDENKKIQKQLKKANTTLAQELKECKAILAKTSKSLGESISVRDSFLVALQTKQTEFEMYKAFNDHTVDYEKLKRKLNDALGQIAHKDIVVREGLKTKAYELLVVKEKHDELMKQSLLTKSHYEGLVKQKTKEMHADLKYVKYLEKEIDELESEKPKFSYALAELQCMYLHKVKECDCLVQKLSKQTESVSKKVHIELLQHFGKVEKHSISLEIALQNCKEQVKNNTVCNEKASNVFRKEREQYFEIQDLKAQMQVKNISISELKKLIEKGKGKFVDTKFDRPSVVRQPNAQRIPKPSVLGKPTPFSYSLERIYFPKTRSVPKTNVSEGLSKPVTTQTIHQTSNKAFAPILGYGDLVQGNVTINRVYYVEGLNHNLFSVGQFCDADLEVAFRKSTCFVRDL